MRGYPTANAWTAQILSTKVVNKPFWRNFSGPAKGLKMKVRTGLLLKEHQLIVSSLQLVLSDTSFLMPLCQCRKSTETERERKSSFIANQEVTEGR